MIETYGHRSRRRYIWSRVAEGALYRQMVDELIAVGVPKRQAQKDVVKYRKQLYDGFVKFRLKYGAEL